MPPEFEPGNDPGVSPTQVRVEYVTVNRALLAGLLTCLLERAPRCQKRGCHAIGRYVTGNKQLRCAAHAADGAKPLPANDWYAVADQLVKECQ